MTTNIHYGENVVLTVRCKDGQYHLDAGGDHDEPWPDPSYAATAGEETWFAVICGTQWGEVSVRVQLVRQLEDVPQAQLDGGDWEIVTERDIEVGDGFINIIEMNTPQPYDTVETGPGLFRARLHMINRIQAMNAGDFVSQVEKHWILIWPVTAPAPVSILRGPDKFAEGY